MSPCRDNLRIVWHSKDKGTEQTLEKECIVLLVKMRGVRQFIYQWAVYQYYSAGNGRKALVPLKLTLPLSSHSYLFLTSITDQFLYFAIVSSRTLICHHLALLGSIWFVLFARLHRSHFISSSRTTRWMF